MENNNTLTVNDHTKVLVPATSYDFTMDSRLLIPFTSGEKIGFINQHQEIVAKPQYLMYYGECYEKEDYIRVAIINPYCVNSNTTKAYHRPLFGLINYKGETVLPIEYYSIKPALDNKNLFTVLNKNSEYGVITAEGVEIVPFGKYDYIGGFDRGVARVKIGKESNSKIDNKNKWGIINEKGEEVLTPEVQQVWNFYGKGYATIIVVNDGVKTKLPFSYFMSNTDNDDDSYCNPNDDDYDYDYRESYGDFAGTYAQDYMGFSDDTIYDAFDGEADAYWNID